MREFLSTCTFYAWKQSLYPDIISADVVRFQRRDLVTDLCCPAAAERLADGISVFGENGPSLSRLIESIEGCMSSLRRPAQMRS